MRKQVISQAEDRIVVVSWKVSSNLNELRPLLRQIKGHRKRVFHLSLGAFDIHPTLDNQPCKGEMHLIHLKTRRARFVTMALLRFNQHDYRHIVLQNANVMRSQGDVKPFNIDPLENIESTKQFTPSPDSLSCDEARVSLSFSSPNYCFWELDDNSIVSCGYARQSLALPATRDSN